MNTNQPRMSRTDPCSSSPWCRNPGHTATSRSSEQELWSAQPSHLPCSHPSGAGTATGKVQTLPSRGRNISLLFAERVFLMKMLLVKSRTSAGITAACRRRWENPLEVGKSTGSGKTHWSPAVGAGTARTAVGQPPPVPCDGIPQHCGGSAPSQFPHSREIVENH